MGSYTDGCMDGWVVPEEPTSCRCGGTEDTGHLGRCPMRRPFD